ncbi:MAG: YerC/YecD family TrpR-related protein [Candidatus Peregrinibacteria bacterium]
MKPRFTEDSWRKEPQFLALVKALTSIQSEDAMAAFLRDIATLAEMQALSERLEVAKQLSRGLSYRQVAKNTGASTTTVTRVASFIENGAGGYRSYLNTHRHHRLIPASQNASAVHSEARGERTASVLQGYLQRTQKKE